MKRFTCTMICAVLFLVLAAPARSGERCDFATGACEYTPINSCCYQGYGWCADMQCDAAPPDALDVTGSCIDPMGCPAKSPVGTQLDQNGGKATAAPSEPCCGSKECRCVADHYLCCPSGNDFECTFVEWC